MPSLDLSNVYLSKGFCLPWRLAITLLCSHIKQTTDLDLDASLTCRLNGAMMQFILRTDQLFSCPCMVSIIHAMMMR